METISKNLKMAMLKNDLDNEKLVEALTEEGVKANTTMISGWLQLDAERVNALSSVLNVDASFFMVKDFN